MLTKPDMGGGGVRPMMMSAKKDILLQLQQIHKQEYLTFELLDLNLFCPTWFFMVPKCALSKYLLAPTFLDKNFVKFVRKKGGGYAQVWPHYLGGVFKFWQMLTWGGGGVKKLQKYADVICERPLLYKYYTYLDWSTLHACNTQSNSSIMNFVVGIFF